MLGSCAICRLSPQGRKNYNRLPARERFRSVSRISSRAPVGSITQSLFSLVRCRKWILADRDRLRVYVLQLVGLSRVELNIFREFWRNVRVCVDGMHGAHFHARHAIDALLR